jgi:hypothetical protein
MPEFDPRAKNEFEAAQNRDAGVRLFISTFTFVLLTIIFRKNRMRVISFLIAVLVLLRVQAEAAEFHFAGTSISDDIFLQEIGWKIPSKQPLTAISALHGVIFAGTTNGLLELSEDKWKTMPEITNSVFRIQTIGSNCWALTTSGPFLYNGSQWRRLGSEPISDVISHRGQILCASGKKLFCYADATGLTSFGTNDCPFTIKRMVSHNESIYVYGDNRLTTFASGQFGGRDVYDFPADQAWDWGALPSPNTRDILGSGSRLFIATDRGLGVLRGMSLTALRGVDGLPFEDDRCLANGFTNDIWIGTSRGAIRHVGNDFHYFAGERWLPGEIVNAIAVEGHTVYIATDGGLGVIQYVPFTLEKKAAYYERHLDAWGQKRLGFTHKLEWDAALKEFVREAGDNDGGYSGDYLAAQCYRFAVTHDPAARAEAVNTFQTMRWLQASTGIPGFIARGIWANGEIGHKATGGSGGYPAEWHPTADGKFEWKGDTSSDELCSHFYSVGIFLELVAQGFEVQQAKDHLAGIAAHLIDHQWKLIDVDGEPTRWGRWDLDYFLTDEGRFDRGLQCLEILSFMKTAASVTQEAKFEKAYADLLNLGYPRHTLRQRNTFPPDSILHFEDQLALWSYWNLLRHESDADLRSIYRRSLERTWEIIRVEQQPWFNFIYAILSGNDAEFGPAAAHLREWPLDLRIWSYQNSHRADLQTPRGYTSQKGGIRSFSPREREPIRWDAWTMQLDGGTAGRDVVEPGSWLLAYWLGRYYGFIKASNPADRTADVDPLPPGVKGARPYTGPPRPSF